MPRHGIWFIITLAISLVLYKTRIYLSDLNRHLRANRSPSRRGPDNTICVLNSFDTTPPLISASRRLRTSRRSGNRLTLQGIFNPGLAGFRVGTPIAL